MVVGGAGAGKAPAGGFRHHQFEKKMISSTPGSVLAYIRYSIFSTHNTQHTPENRRMPPKPRPLPGPPVGPWGDYGAPAPKPPGKFVWTWGKR